MSLWFKNGNGHHFHVDEGTEAHKRMLEGGFEPCEDPAAESEPEAPPPADFSKLTKAQLLAVAAERGIEVDGDLTKAQVIELLGAPQGVVEGTEADDGPGA